jgi:serine/threonine-protein kinase
MAQPHADRNLLFGILALQLDFISPDQLVAAMKAWVDNKDRPLGEILVGQQALAADARAALEVLVEKHLEQHDHQPQRSLASLSLHPDVRADLDRIGDAELHGTLATVLPVPVPPHLWPFRAPGESTSWPDADEAVGTVGERTASGLRFRVVRPHAEGGLGQVSVARDEELNRDVALKEIKPQYADNAAARLRFVTEAEVTGGLEHPGIVPVYGLGCFADGRPFYAMRFVQGDNLQQAIERFHATDWSRHRASERQLALRGLLRRFVDVCNAVAYAHSRGVLHRDIKPANVLLGPYGETLLVDWGLAKVLQPHEGQAVPTEGFWRPSGAEVVTQAGAVVGTPAYMAPEQAGGGALGPAADVYGLGATLYHLLAGRAPFAAPHVLDILMRVVEGEYRPAREVNPSVPAALSAVCQKAMALLPQDRYRSAKELAAEVDRWLADEPVAACREPWPARLGRWARRHRPLVASAAALLVTAVVALVVGIVAVNREQKRTEKALAAESQSRRRTREALDEMSSQVIEDWLVRRGQLEPAQRAFLEKALNYYEAFAEESGQTEEARKGVANAHLRAGNIRRRLGQNAEAEAAYRRAQELYAALANDFPAVALYRLELAVTQANLGVLLKDTGRAPQAEAAYRDALAVLKALAADFPAVPGYRLELARTHKHLGWLLAITGRAQEAEAGYQDALAVCQRLTADFPAEAGYRQELAASYQILAMLLGETGRPKEAEAAYHDALAIFKPLADDFPTNPNHLHNLAAVYLTLGNLLKDTGRAAQAEQAYRDALALFRRLAVDFPGAPWNRWELALSHMNLGNLLVDMNRPKEGETALRDAVDIQRQLAADFPSVPQYRQELARGHQSLANLLKNTGRAKEAEAAYARALAIQKQLVIDFPTAPSYHCDLANVLIGLAELARGRKEYGAARQLLEQARPHLQAALDATPLDRYYRAVFRDHRLLLTATLRDLGGHAAAELPRSPVGEEIRLAWQKALEQNPPQHNEWWGYAELCLFLENEGAYRRARQALLKRFGAATDPVVADRTAKACLLLPGAADELHQAAALADRAVAAGPQHPWFAYFQLVKGLAEFRQGHFDSADEQLRAAMTPKAPTTITVPARLVLAMMHQRRGRPQEARQMLAAAVVAFDWEASNAGDVDAWVCHVLRRQAEALILPNLPAFLRGEYQPRDNDERLALLGACQFKGLRRTAARLYADAFAADAKLAEEMNTQHRYSAACHAALAGCGQGDDMVHIDDQERASWRKQALDWLRADLKVYAQRLQTGKPEDRSQVEQRLRHWQGDADLSGVRDQGALAKVPAAERPAWGALWAEVDALLEKARSKP